MIDARLLCIFLLGCSAATARMTALGAIDFPSEHGDPLHALHVRLSVTNCCDDTALRFDAREQRLEGESTQMPPFFDSDEAALPLVAVARNETKATDLYFTLSPMETQKLDPYALRWRVHTARGVVSGLIQLSRALADRPTKRTASPQLARRFWNWFFESSKRTPLLTPQPNN